MGEKREIDIRESVRVATDNEFIMAKGLQDLSIKARKLLYIAISQCRRTDKGFYEYSLSIPEFASMMDIATTNVYKEAYKITAELTSAKITIVPEGRKRFTHYPLTSICEYDDNSYLRIELNPRMTDFLLALKGSFTQPLLNDFLKMNSPYSMAIWHLFQREMHSKKPFISEVIQFDITLEELRKVTGCQEKLKQLSEFKNRVLDKALREIRDNCGVDITYINLKKERTVIGFRFSAISQFHISEDKISQGVKDKTRLKMLEMKSKKSELSSKEKQEYDYLVSHCKQMELDFD